MHSNYPILVTVPSKEDIVANVVVVQVLEGSIAVGGIPLAEEERYQHLEAESLSSDVGRYLPHIPVVPVDAERLDDAREDDLVANDTPCSASASRFGELSVEPILLVGSHQSTRRVIHEKIDVVVVPA